MKGCQKDGSVRACFGGGGCRSVALQKKSEKGCS